MGERIRTPDLLVRSQTLYPAELRPHSIYMLFLPFKAKIIIVHISASVNKKNETLKIFCGKSVFAQLDGTYRKVTYTYLLTSGRL